MAAGTGKQQVRAYWESLPCGTFAGSGPAGSSAWFEAIEASRYRREPCIHSFAQFSRWRHKEVLEIGCGAGTDTVQFARAGARVTAIDLTGAGVALTRQRLALENLSGDVREGDAEALPLVANRFDLVYSWGVLHHTPNTARAIEEIHRVLKPGGCCVAMLYGRRSLTAWRLWTKHALRAGKPFRSVADVVRRHVESAGTKAYTRGELGQLFRRFAELKVDPVLTVYDLHRLPVWLQCWLPQAWGWFLVVRGVKPGCAEQ